MGTSVASREGEVLRALARGVGIPKDFDAGEYTVDHALVAMGSRSCAQLGEAGSWLLANQGREGHWLWRWKFRWGERHVRFDATKVGWGWTPATTSWVIPTALAIIALRRARNHGVVDAVWAQQRIALGQAMLVDRVCAGGGWNAGNPEVYGVALRPHVDTTAIALLGLQDCHGCAAVRTSIEWLQASASACRSAYSLAWAALACATLRQHGVDFRLNTMAPLRENDPVVAALQELAAAGPHNPFLVEPER